MNRISLNLVIATDDDYMFVDYLLSDESEPEEFVEECEEECDWINYGNNLVVSSEWREWNEWRTNRAKIHALERDGILHWNDELGRWITNDGNGWALP